MFQGEIAGYSISHEDEQRYVDWLNENRDIIIHINAPIRIKNPFLFKTKVKMQRIIFYFKRQFAERKYIRTYDYIKWSKR